MVPIGIVSADDDPRPDQRVVFGVTATCGECDRCRAGLTAKCRHVLKVGHERFVDSGRGEPWSLSGTYASHIHLRAGVAAVPVPEDLPAATAATAGCAVETVMAMMEQAGRGCAGFRNGTGQCDGAKLGGKRVLVTGLGMLGLVAVAVAVREGAASVYVSDLNPARVELARRLGAVEVGEGMPPNADVVLELSGAATAVEQCIHSVDVGGTVVLAGSVAPAGEVSVDPEAIVRGWLTVTGVHNYEPRHLQQAVDFLVADYREGVRVDSGGGVGETLHGIASQVVSAPTPLAELAGVFAEDSQYLRTVVDCRALPAVVAGDQSSNAAFTQRMAARVFGTPM